MPPKKMENKVNALESEVANLKHALAETRVQAAKDQDHLISLITKSIEQGSPKKSLEGEKEDEVEGEILRKTKGSFQKFHGDMLDEFRQSVKKIELPMFTGEDPAGWIARAEVYFRVLDISPEIKVSLAQLCMEGSTIHFFKAWSEDEADPSWERFKDALLERYGEIGDGNIYEQLASIRQKGDLEVYIKEFEKLSSQVYQLPDAQYLGYFIHGLRDGVRGRVRSLVAMGPVTRTKLMKMARAVEMEMKGMTDLAILAADDNQILNS